MIDDRELSEEEARELWRRAAELQAEAARRLEARSRSLADAEDEEAPTGYRLADVRAAAVEAGIGEEFVLQALAEGEGGAATTGRSDTAAARFLGEGAPREVVVSRMYDAPPAEVYGVLQRILPAAPFELVLADSRGGHPLEGGVLVFEVPPIQLGEAAGFAYELRGWGDIQEILVALRPVGEQRRRTEVTLRASLAHSRRVNLWVGGAFVGTGSGVMGVVAAALAGAAASAAGLASLLAVVVVLAGVGAFGSAAVLGTFLWRSLYGWAVGRGEAALEKVLAAVDVHLRTGGAFGSAGGWPAVPPGPGPAPDAGDSGRGSGTPRAG